LLFWAVSADSCPPFSVFAKICRIFDAFASLDVVSHQTRCANTSIFWAVYTVFIVAFLAKDTSVTEVVVRSYLVADKALHTLVRMLVSFVNLVHMV
jgi:hypothetical protein